MIDVNLNGTFFCIHHFLPMMRAAGTGTIINISSDAGLQANAKAGGGYAASKFAVRGLTQSLNAEERVNGIRACTIFPGDIDTPMLNLRPNPPTPEARSKMLQPEDVARCVMLVIDLPRRAVIEEILIRPQ
jgi:NADP-dependent 3-hydroxy acid dehydrogenase YdfG